MTILGWRQKVKVQGHGEIKYTGNSTLRAETYNTRRLMAWFKGRRPPGAVLHSPREPGELSQWLCRDDSTMNISLGITTSGL